MTGATAVTLEAQRKKRRDLLELAVIAVSLSLFLGLGYYLLGHYNHSMDQAGTQVWQPKIFLDDHIPFSPIWIYPYLLYFPLCCTPFVFAGNIRSVRRIAAGYLLAHIPCLILFMLIPTMIVRPEFEVVDTSTRLVAWLYSWDPGYNILPSLHVTDAVLVAWIFQRLAPRWAPLLWLGAGSIAFATVLVKQHYFIDVPTGFLLGSAAFFIAFRGYPAPAKEEEPEPMPAPAG